MDIKYFYLGTLMKDLKYLRVPILTFLDEIIQQYNLRTIVHTVKHGDEQRKHTHGLLNNHTHDITLVVNSFGTKHAKGANL